jgi:hypothetical protein
MRRIGKSVARRRHCRRPPTQRRNQKETQTVFGTTVVVGRTSRPEHNADLRRVVGDVGTNVETRSMNNQTKSRMREKHSWTTWLAPLVVLPFYPISLIMNDPIGFLAKVKFKFDLGSSFMNIITFCLLSVTASPILAGAVGVSTRLVLAILVPATFVGMFIFGHVLHVSGYLNRYQDEQNKCNELLQQLKKEKQ